MSPAYGWCLVLGDTPHDGCPGRAREDDQDRRDCSCPCHPWNQEASSDHEPDVMFDNVHTREL